MPPGPTFKIVDDLEDFHARQLEWFEDMADGGQVLAPAAALFYCSKHGLIPPARLVNRAANGFSDALNKDIKKKRGRSAEPVERYRQDLIDYARWEEVRTVRDKQKEFRDEVETLSAMKPIPVNLLAEKQKMLDWLGHTLERAYECASMILRETPAFGGSDAVKASYFRVERNNRDRNLRYHQFDQDFLASIGVEHPRLWGQKVRKHVPFYDLTL